MSQDYFNTDIIDLQDKDLKIDAVITKDNVKTLLVSKPIEKSNKSCIFCESTNIKINCYYKRSIRFLSIGVYKSIIIYNQRRFICSNCNKTFNESSSLVEKGSTISNQLKITLLEKSRLKISFSDLANQCDVSITTAIKEFKTHISDYRSKLT